jgi:serine/threonine-protein kinase
VTPAAQAQPSAGEWARSARSSRSFRRPEQRRAPRRIGEEGGQRDGADGVRRVELRAPQGKPDKPLPEYVAKNTIGGFSGQGGGFLYGINALVPIEQIGANVAGLGHLTTVLDEDGATRYEPLVIDYYGQQFPSMALMLAARSLNLTAKDIKVKLGESVTVGGKTIRTDDAAQMYTYFYKDRAPGQPAFTTDSFFDVYSGKIPRRSTPTRSCSSARPRPASARAR